MWRDKRKYSSASVNLNWTLLQNNKIEDTISLVGDKGNDKPLEYNVPF